jgi:hypothetical protein
MVNRQLEVELGDVLVEYGLKSVIITMENGETISEINITPEIKNSGLYKVLLWDKETARTT